MNSLEDSYSHRLGKYGTVEEMLEDRVLSRYECHVYGPISINNDRPNASSKGSKALFCGCFYKDVFYKDVFNYKD